VSLGASAPVLMLSLPFFTQGRGPHDFVGMHRPWRAERQLRRRLRVRARLQPVVAPQYQARQDRWGRLQGSLTLLVLGGGSNVKSNCRREAVFPPSISCFKHDKSFTAGNRRLDFAGIPSLAGTRGLEMSSNKRFHGGTHHRSIYWCGCQGELVANLPRKRNHGSVS